MKLKRVLIVVAMLTSSVLAACTEADRDAIFSTRRAPQVGSCDPQPGYPPPSERPGCEAAQGKSHGGSGGR
jgi:hypothetical protein